MEYVPSSAAAWPVYTPKSASAIAGCVSTISRLDARIAVSPVTAAWMIRSAWSGYARALQLQGSEIDEIDVFSWACGLQIPGRPLRATNVDEFDRFESWQPYLREKAPLAWRDDLPTAIIDPHNAKDHPPLIRAIDRVRQHARIDGTILPWLGVPLALRDLGATRTPLPCLAGGAKAFRLKRQLDEADWLAVIRSIEAAASMGLERLDQLERLYRDARRAIAREFRAGALPSLLALSMSRPLLSPQSVANFLNMSVAGASKLLERAVGSGLIVEVTRRRTWRVFLSADVARAFGLVKPGPGRPRKEPPALDPTPDLSEVLSVFDEQMAEIELMLVNSGRHRAVLPF